MNLPHSYRSRAARIVLSAWALCLAAQLSCNKSDGPTPASVDSAGAPASPAAVPAPGTDSEQLADEDLALPEDFAEEANNAINEKNYASEVDSLEKEINSTEE